jgi:hypothetical protein
VLAPDALVDSVAETALMSRLHALSAMVQDEKRKRELNMDESEKVPSPAIERDPADVVTTIVFNQVTRQIAITSDALSDKMMMYAILECAKDNVRQFIERGSSEEGGPRIVRAH